MYKNIKNCIYTFSWQMIFGINNKAFDYMHTKYGYAYIVSGQSQVYIFLNYL